MTGARFVGDDTWTEPAWRVATHTAEVSRTRLYLEGVQAGRGEPLQEWVSERRWRGEHTAAIRAGAHVPDGVAVLADGRQAAIEVELSDKGPTRVASIAAELAGAYPVVLYVVPAESATARRAYTALDEQKRVQLSQGARLGVLDVVELPERVR